jgi:predicted phage terminase large subunit-like protein
MESPKEIVNPALKEMREKIIEHERLFMIMLKEKATKSLFLFNKYILKAEEGDEQFVKLGAFHKTVCNFLQDRPDKRKLVLIPRSHLKTKMLSVGYPTMKIANNPKIRVLIYSATWQMAVDIHKNIQKNLQSSERLIQLYGDYFSGAKEWAQDRTRLAQNDKREPTITAAGIDNNLVGGHYDLIIMDDVVNRDNVGTMDQINKVITRYKDSLDLLEPKGELIVIGTRWHDSDLYGWIMDPGNQAMDNYLTLESVGHPEIMRAFEGSLLTDEGFKPLWEGKFTRKDFLAKLKEEGWGHFSAQYLNDPVPEEDAIFKRPWFKYYTYDDIKGKLLNKFLLIDPALSLNKDADYTAMIVVGIDEYNNIFILDITRQRMSPNDIIEEIFRLNDKWSLVDTAIEQVAFQKVLGYYLREDPRFKMRPFHITELKPNERSKDQRIKGLQPLYENGKIFHSKELPNTMYLEDELVRFPRSKNDDIIDALAYAPDIVFPSKQRTSVRRGSRRYLYA